LAIWNALSTSSESFFSSGAQALGDLAGQNPLRQMQRIRSLLDKLPLPKRPYATFVRRPPSQADGPPREQSLLPP